MQQSQKNKELIIHFLPSFLILVLLLLLAFYTYTKTSSLKNDVSLLTNELQVTRNELQSNANKFSKNIQELNSETTGIHKTLTSTKQNIEDVKVQVGGVTQEVGSISGEVNNLQKLSKTDPQLLKKYSKVYFLNENYTPAHLTSIPSEYNYSDTKQEQFQSETWGSLKRLLDAANKDGVTIFVKSGYRSFLEQKTLKTAYTSTYGAGTSNTFSADQGYSEHQLGTTIDFITTGLSGQLQGFETTEAHTWLTNNAHYFGFTLSYPKGNKFYIFEPWHWRYVGVKLATYLYTNKLHFYDLDQREIDTYLINFFD